MAMRKWVAWQVLGSMLAFVGCGDDSATDGGGTGGGHNACIPSAFSCPATEQVRATCWALNVACSTVTACTSGRTVACPEEGQQVDCESGLCLSCPPPEETDSPLARCMKEHCCLAAGRCAADPGCLPCLAGGSCTGNDNAAVAAYMGCIAESCSNPSQ
jgi:hypothetical protein